MSSLSAQDLPGSTALSLSVSGRWAHFRNIEGTLDRTYTLIPRTTAAGLLAAIVGVPRDEYYDIFAPERARIAITLDDHDGTYPMSRLYLGTREEEGELTISKSGSGVISTRGDEPATEALTDALGGLPSPKAIYGHHQRPIIHMVRNPSYTIDVVLASNGEAGAFRQDLTEHLTAGTSVYTPYLGTAECLARVEYLGEHPVSPHSSDAPAIDSALPLTALNPAASPTFTVEKHPHTMVKDGPGRRLDDTISLGVSMDDPLTATEPCGFEIGETGRTVAML